MKRGHLTCESHENENIKHIEKVEKKIVRKRDATVMQNAHQ